MKPEVETLVRSVGELTALGRFAKYADPDRRLITLPSVVNAFVSNPFVRTKDQPAQVLGVVGDRIIGGVGALPMRMVADGKNYETSAGPDILVNAAFRNTGFALDLIEAGRVMSPDKITVDFYVSRAARKVGALMGGAVFDIAQFAIVRKSIEFFGSRIPSCVRWLACPLLDCAFALHRMAVRVVVALRTRGWRLEDVSKEQGLADFAALVEKDAHRFREDVSVAFLKWLFANDFDSVAMADKHLWRVSRGDVVYGYVMTRVSNRGRRGRIIEWQTTDGNEDKLPWMLLKAALQTIGKTNAVVFSFSTEDAVLFRPFKWLLPRLPVQAATVGVGEDSPLERHPGWREQKNWRIRPAMGDCGLY